MKRYARAIVRAWWPELLFTAAMLVVALAGGYAGAVTAISFMATGAAFWAMGFRHRRMPLHAKVDRIGEAVGEVKDILTAQAPAEDRRPWLTVVKGDRP